MTEILVLVDHADGEVKKPTYELLTIAKRLGEPSAVFIGESGKSGEVAEKVKKYGAEKVYVVDDAQIKGYLVAPKAEALQQLAEKASPAAILIASAERAGKTLSLPDRATRLLRDLGPSAAIFSADGEIVAAESAAVERMGNQRDLLALGAEKLAREASLNDIAEGEIQAGHITMIKLGAGSTFALLVVFTEPAVPARSGAQTNAVGDTPKISDPVELQLQLRPFRFVWQTDAETCFTLTSQEFVDPLGAKSAAVLGRSWAEIAKTLTLDPSGEIANALSRHETFSGIETA